MFVCLFEVCHYLLVFCYLTPHTCCSSFLCVYLSLQISGSIGSFVDGNKRSNTSREGPTKKWCAHKMGDYKDGS